MASHNFLLTPPIVVSPTMLLRLLLMAYHTGWTVGLYREFVTQADELDTPAISFSSRTAQRTAGQALQQPLHPSHFRSLLQHFAYAVSSPTL